MGAMSHARVGISVGWVEPFVIARHAHASLVVAMLSLGTAGSVHLAADCGYNATHMELDKLIAQLDAEDLEQARNMTPSQKLRAGGDLFDDACRWTLAGIRRQHPKFTPEQAMDELRRRLDQAEAMEDLLP